MNFKEEFKKIIDENGIVLFLKGTKDMPVCGFSKTVVNLLDHYGVKSAVKALAEPPDDPPGTVFSAIGFITFPK